MESSVAWVFPRHQRNICTICNDNPCNQQIMHSNQSEPGLRVLQGMRSSTLKHAETFSGCIKVLVGSVDIKVFRVLGDDQLLGRCGVFFFLFSRPMVIISSGNWKGVSFDCISNQLIQCLNFPLLETNQGFCIHRFFSPFFTRLSIFKFVPMGTVADKVKEYRIKKNYAWGRAARYWTRDSSKEAGRYDAKKKNSTKTWDTARSMSHQFWTSFCVYCVLAP